MLPVSFKKKKKSRCSNSYNKGKKCPVELELWSGDRYFSVEESVHYWVWISTANMFWGSLNLKATSLGFLFLTLLCCQTVGKEIDLVSKAQGNYQSLPCPWGWIYPAQHFPLPWYERTPLREQRDNKVIQGAILLRNEFPFQAKSNCREILNCASVIIDKECFHYALSMTLLKSVQSALIMLM